MSTFPLIREDFEQYDWQNCINSSTDKRCTSYVRCFLEKAAEAKAYGDDKAHALFTLLSDITYPVLQWKNHDTPFLPAHILLRYTRSILSFLQKLSHRLLTPKCVLVSQTSSG